MKVTITDESYNRVEKYAVRLNGHVITTERYRVNATTIKENLEKALGIQPDEPIIEDNNKLASKEALRKTNKRVNKLEETSKFYSWLCMKSVSERGFESWIRDIVKEEIYNTFKDVGKGSEYGSQK